MRIESSLRQLVEIYDPDVPLAEASAIPAPWYTDTRIAELEACTVFSRNWQCVGRADQVEKHGQYLTCELAGEPLAVIRGGDGVLRGFFNVCRHHASAVLTEPEGQEERLRCPYHGWTYSLEGELTATPDFAGVSHFDRDLMGLVPIETGIWEKWVFVRLDRGGPALESQIGNELAAQIHLLNLARFTWIERRIYVVECNWKVFVDNYLDGGYHVPHIHKGLNSVLDYSNYTVRNGERFCLQCSPIAGEGAEEKTGAVRKGERALYYWIHPNFMINWYEGALDTNLVIPRGADRTEVIFDFYSIDNSRETREQNLASIAVAEGIQEEDAAVCQSVQRGLASRAGAAGRLSVRREAGVHLFHRLLSADLRVGLHT